MNYSCEILSLGCALSGIETPLKLYCDIIFQQQQKLIQVKYIAIKLLVVKEKVQNGQILIEHTGIDSMIADSFTKRLTPKVFHEHTASMCVISLKDIMI